MRKSPARLQSIDVFRAITMLLMVFVNDLDPIQGVPEWIKHVGRDVDGLGFADTIFPAFLFIVGLSIPFAVRGRLAKGDTPVQVFGHIALRALALLIMGFFHVNLENYDIHSALLPKAAWEIIITLAFFAIWLDFPKNIRPAKRLLIQGAGILALIAMAILFKGGKPEHPEGLSPHWWGILGLIGWAYLLSATIFLVSKGRLQVQILAALLFLAFNVAIHAHWLGDLSGVHHYIWIAGNGAMPALTMGGIVTTLLYLDRLEKQKTFLLPGFVFGAGLIGLGFLFRVFGGISKVHDTPAWVCICMGLSVWTFALLTWLVDMKGKASWFAWCRPAGTSTLTCYLIPYLLYSVYMLFHFKFPPLLNEGTGGLIKSMVTALFCVWVTSLLEKRRLRLKI